MSKDILSLSEFTSGSHVLLDFWGAIAASDIAFIEAAMRETAKSCEARVLDVKLHAFGEGAGVTGVAILAESHISIHTWPENDFMALDVFMCGNADAQRAIAVLLSLFKPESWNIHTQMRGEKRHNMS